MFGRKIFGLKISAEKVSAEKVSAEKFSAEKISAEKFSAENFSVENFRPKKLSLSWGRRRRPGVCVFRIVLGYVFQGGSFSMVRQVEKHLKDIRIEVDEEVNEISDVQKNLVMYLAWSLHKSNNESANRFLKNY